MSELQDALRRRFRSPAEALRHIDIDPAILDEERNSNMTTSFTRDRGFTRARKLGRDDEEEARQELREMINDPEATFGDLLACVIEHAGDDPDSLMEVNEALSSVAEDRRRGRSPRQWAADRLERRRGARDARAKRARDGEYGGPERFPGMPERGGSMTPLEREGEDRRRGAMDMAYDRSSEAAFLARFPMLRGRLPERF